MNSMDGSVKKEHVGPSGSNNEGHAAPHLKRSRRVKKVVDAALSGGSTDEGSVKSYKKVVKRSLKTNKKPSDADNCVRKSQRTRKLSYKAQSSSFLCEDVKEEEEEKPLRPGYSSIVCSICGNSFSRGKGGIENSQADNLISLPFSILTESERRSLCFKCAVNVEKQTSFPKGPTLQERAVFEDEGKVFAQGLVKILGDGQASNLYCCSFYQANRCGCIQSYVEGKLLKKRKKFKAENFLQNFASDEDLKLRAPDEAADPVEKAQFFLTLYKDTIKRKEEIITARHIEKKSGGGDKFPTMPQEFTNFILSRRHILRTLGLCERGCQKVLRYSNNFLHKKTASGARSSMPRLPKTKGKTVANLTKFEDLPSKTCCPHQCVNMATTDVDTLSGWRYQAKLSQKSCWKVISEMVKLNDKGHTNCSKFIAMVTGCCMFTIKKVKAILLLSKGKEDWREHGLKRHWKELREERAAAIANASVEMKPSFSSSPKNSPIASSSTVASTPAALIASTPVVWYPVISQPNYSAHAKPKNKKTTSLPKPIMALSTVNTTTITTTATTSLPLSEAEWITVTIPTTAAPRSTTDTTITTSTNTFSSSLISSPPVSLSRNVPRSSVTVPQNAVNTTVPIPNPATPTTPKDLVEQIAEKHRKQLEELKKQQEEEIQLAKQQQIQHLQQQIHPQQTETLNQMGKSLKKTLNTPDQQQSQNSAPTLISLLQVKSLPPNQNSSLSPVASNCRGSGHTGKSENIQRNVTSGASLLVTDASLQTRPMVSIMNSSQDLPKPDAERNDTNLKLSTVDLQGPSASITNLPISISPCSSSLSHNYFSSSSSSSSSCSLSSPPSFQSHFYPAISIASLQTQPIKSGSASRPQTLVGLQTYSSPSLLSSSLQPSDTKQESTFVVTSQDRSPGTVPPSNSIPPLHDTGGYGSSSITTINLEPQIFINSTTASLACNETHNVFLSGLKGTSPLKSRSRPRIGIVHPHNALPKINKSLRREEESLSNRIHRNSGNMSEPSTNNSYVENMTPSRHETPSHVSISQESLTNCTLVTTSSMVCLSSDIETRGGYDTHRVHQRNLADNIRQNSVGVLPPQLSQVVMQSNSENQTYVSHSAEASQVLVVQQPSHQEEGNQQHCDQPQFHQQQPVHRGAVQNNAESFLPQQSHSQFSVLTLENAMSNTSNDSESHHMTNTRCLESKSERNMNTVCNIVTSNIQPIVSAAVTASDALKTVLDNSNQVLARQVLCQQTGESKLEFLSKDDKGNIVPLSNLGSQQLILNVDNMGNMILAKSSPQSDNVVIDNSNDTRGVSSLNSLNHGNVTSQIPLDIRTLQQHQQEQAQQYALFQQQQHVGPRQELQKQQLIHQTLKQPQHIAPISMPVHSIQNISNEISLNKGGEPLPSPHHGFINSHLDLLSSSINNNNQAFLATQQTGIVNLNSAPTEEGRQKETINSSQSGKFNPDVSQSNVLTSTDISTPLTSTDISNPRHLVKSKQPKGVEATVPQQGSGTGTQNTILFIPDKPGYPRYQLTRLDPLPSPGVRDSVSQQSSAPTSTTPKPSTSSSSMSLPDPQVLLQLLMQGLGNDNIKLTTENGETQLVLSLPQTKSSLDSSQPENKDQHKTTMANVGVDANSRVSLDKDFNVVDQTLMAQNVSLRNQPGKAVLSDQKMVFSERQQKEQYYLSQTTIPGSHEQEASVELVSSYGPSQQTLDPGNMNKKSQPSFHIIGSSKIGSLVRHSSSSLPEDEMNAAKREDDNNRNGRILQTDEKGATAPVAQRAELQSLGKVTTLNLNTSMLLDTQQSKLLNPEVFYGNSSQSQGAHVRPFVQNDRVASNSSAAHNNLLEFPSSKVVIDITEDTPPSSPKRAKHLEQSSNQKLPPRFSTLLCKQLSEGPTSSHSPFNGNDGVIDKTNHPPFKLSQQQFMTQNEVLFNRQTEANLLMMSQKKGPVNIESVSDERPSGVLSTRPNINNEKNMPHRSQKLVTNQNSTNKDVLVNYLEGSSTQIYPESSISHVSNVNALSYSTNPCRMRTTSETGPMIHPSNVANTLNKPIAHRAKSSSESESSQTGVKSFHVVGSSSFNQRPGSLIRPASASPFNSSSVTFFRDTNTPDNSIGPPNVTILSPSHSGDKHLLKFGSYASLSNHKFERQMNEIRQQTVFDMKKPCALNSPSSSTSSMSMTNSAPQYEKGSLQLYEMVSPSPSTLPQAVKSPATSITLGIDHQAGNLTNGHNTVQSVTSLGTASNISVGDGSLGTMASSITTQSGPAVTRSITSQSITFTLPSSQIKPTTTTTTTKPRIRSKPKTIRDYLNSQQQQGVSNPQFAQANPQISTFSLSLPTGGTNSNDGSRVILLPPNSHITPSTATATDSSLQSTRVQQEIQNTQILQNTTSPKYPVLGLKQSSDNTSGVYCVQNADGSYILLSSANLNLATSDVLEKESLKQSVEMTDKVDNGNGITMKQGPRGKETILSNKRSMSMGQSKPPCHDITTNAVMGNAGIQQLPSSSSHKELPLIGQPAVAACAFLQNTSHANLVLETVSNNQGIYRNTSSQIEQPVETGVPAKSSSSHSNSRGNVTAALSTIDRVRSIPRHIKPHILTVSQGQSPHRTSELKTLLQDAPAPARVDEVSGKSYTSFQKENSSLSLKDNDRHHISADKTQTPNGSVVAVSHELSNEPNSTKLSVYVNSSKNNGKQPMPVSSHILHQGRLSDGITPYSIAPSQTVLGKQNSSLLSNLLLKSSTQANYASSKSNNRSPRQAGETSNNCDSSYQALHKNGGKNMGNLTKQDSLNQAVMNNAVEVCSSQSDRTEGELPGKEVKGGWRRDVTQHRKDISPSETCPPKSNSPAANIGLSEMDQNLADSQTTPGSNPRGIISNVIESLYHAPYTNGGENQNLHNPHHYTPDQTMWREHGAGNILMDSFPPPPPYPHDKYKDSNIGRDLGAIKKRKLVVECVNNQSESNFLYCNEADNESVVPVSQEGWKRKKTKLRSDKGKKSDNRSFNSADMKKRVQFLDTVTRESHQNPPNVRPSKRTSTPVRTLSLAESSQLESRKELMEGTMKSPLVQDVQGTIYDFQSKYPRLGEQSTEYSSLGHKESFAPSNSMNAKLGMSDISGSQPTPVYDHNQLQTFQYYPDTPQHHKQIYYEEPYNSEGQLVTSEPGDTSSVTPLEIAGAHDSTGYIHSSAQQPVSDGRKSWASATHLSVEKSPVSKREKDGIISFVGDRDKLHKPSPVIKAHPDKLTNASDLEESRFLTQERPMDRIGVDFRQQEGMRQSWETAMSERKTSFKIISPHGYNKLSERSYLHSGKEDRNIVSTPPNSHSYSPRCHRTILRPPLPTTSFDYMDETRNIVDDTNHIEQTSGKIHNSLSIINTEDSTGRAMSDSPILRHRALENDFGIAQQMNQQQQQRSRHPSHEILRLVESTSSPYPGSSKFSSPSDLDRLPEPSTLGLQDILSHDPVLYKETMQLLEDNLLLKQQVMKGEHRHRKLSAMDRLKNGESTDGELPGKQPSVPSSPLLFAYSPSREAGRLSLLDYLSFRHQENRSRNPSGSHSMATRRLDMDIGIIHLDHSSSPLDSHIVNPPSGLFRPLSSSQEEDSQDPLMRAVTNVASQRGQTTDPDYDGQARHRNLSSSSLKSSFNDLADFDLGSRSRNPSTSSLFRSLESSFVMRSRNPSGSSNRRSRPGSSSSDRDPFTFPLDDHEFMSLLQNSISPSSF